MRRHQHLFISFLLLLFSSPFSPLNAETFRVKTADSIQLTGDYRPPKTSKDPVLILLHGLGSTRAEWAPLIKLAALRGWGTLAYDARGHGQSQTTVDGKTVSYQSPTYGRDPAFWKGMIGDLTLTLQVLEKRKKIASQRIVLIGASLGANVALNAAAENSSIPAVVLLSPGMAYAGIETETPIRRWGRPLLLVAAKPDQYAYQSIYALRGLAADARRIEVISPETGGPQGAHGTQLFDGALEKKILDWITKQR